MKVSWTQGMDDELRAMLEQGLSCSEIARRLQARFRRTFTKSSVIGRKHRLGISGPNTNNGGGQAATREDDEKLLEALSMIERGVSIEKAARAVSKDRRIVSECLKFARDAA